MLLNPKSLVAVFDLDDTLYKEVDFVRSAYSHIAESLGMCIFDEMWSGYVTGEDVFERVLAKYSLPLDVAKLVEMYRFHFPNISLLPGARSLLESLAASGVRLAIITDGRQLTQSNKLKALGVDQMFDVTIISESFGSEKPCPANFQAVEQAFPHQRYMYVADNFKKDFVTPNRLGWKTIGLADDGRNIHSQLGVFPADHYPRFLVECLTEIDVIRFD